VEIDDWVVDNANDNLLANDRENVSLVCGTAEALRSVPNEYYPIVLANIHREVILSDLSEYTRVLSPGGWLLLSGLQRADESMVVAYGESIGLNHSLTDFRGDWICLQFHKL